MTDMNQYREFERWAMPLRAEIMESPAGTYGTNYGKVVETIAEVYLLEIPEDPDTLALVNGYIKGLVAERGGVE